MYRVFKNILNIYSAGETKSMRLRGVHMSFSTYMVLQDSLKYEYLPADLLTYIFIIPIIAWRLKIDITVKTPS